MDAETNVMLCHWMPPLQGAALLLTLILFALGCNGLELEVNDAPSYCGPGTTYDAELGACVGTQDPTPEPAPQADSPSLSNAEENLPDAPNLTILLTWNSPSSLDLFVQTPEGIEIGPTSTQTDAGHYLPADPNCHHQGQCITQVDWFKLNNSHQHEPFRIWAVNAGNLPVQAELTVFRDSKALQSWLISLPGAAGASSNQILFDYQSDPTETNCLGASCQDDEAPNVPDPTSCQGPGCEQEEEFLRHLIEEVNLARSQHQNCGSYGSFPPAPPVTGHPQLHEASQLHAVDMAENWFFDHIGSNGSTFADRIYATGYPGTPVGENLAGGGHDPAYVVELWLNSDGHCRNLMDSDANEAGVGFALGGEVGTMWVLKTGRR